MNDNHRTRLLPVTQRSYELRGRALTKEEEVVKGDVKT
jgi:hypothetical protein